MLLILLRSPETHIKWLLHVVAAVASKSHLGSVRAFAGNVYAFNVHLGSWFIVIPKRLGAILSSSTSLVRGGSRHC